VLAQRDPATGEPRGISAALARTLAERLGVPIEFIAFPAAGKVTAAIEANPDAWDVAFVAIDPVRAAHIAFTAPYVVIEGGYLVPNGSRLASNDDVDRAGIRIAVSGGSVYDLYLTRAIHRATLVREPQGPAASFDLFLRERLEAAAGVKQQLVGFAAAHPGTRLLPGRFMAIEQAMATPRKRAVGARYLRRFVEDMKASGMVARELAASGHADATIAPPAPAE
jgi:polar amino acid transport system substrate-binding protein